MIKQLYNTKFKKNILLTTSGALVSQLINFVSSPIITRIYNPNEYGTFTYFVSIVSIISVIGSLRYESSIAIATRKNVSKIMLINSFMILMILFLFSWLVILIYKLFGLNLVGRMKEATYFYFIPIGFLLTGLYNILSQWFYRNQNFLTITKTKVTQSLGQVSLKITLGLVSLKSTGLIVGRLLGQVCGLIQMIIPTVSYLKKDNSTVSLKRLLFGLKRYKRFFIFGAPSQLINALGLQLPIICLSSFYGPKETGLFGLSYAIISLPVNIIGLSIADVFYSKAVNIGNSNPGALKRLSKKLVIHLLVIGTGPLIVLLLFGPVLFSVVFGEKWVNAGVYAQILSFSAFSRFVFFPVSRVFEVYEKQKEAFAIDIARFLLVLLGFTIAKVFSINSFYSIGIYSLIMTIIYGYTFSISRKILNTQIRKINVSNI